MDITALKATIFRSLAQMDHSGGDKSLEETTHFSCLEYNWSHWRSIHTLLLPTFHLLTLVQLSSTHHLWTFKACLTKHTIQYMIVCSHTPIAPPLQVLPQLFTAHNTSTWFAHYCVYINFFSCKHAEPNSPTNLSALVTCDSQGYKIKIEWKV